MKQRKWLLYHEKITSKIHILPQQHVFHGRLGTTCDQMNINRMNIFDSYTPHPCNNSLDNHLLLTLGTLDHSIDDNPFQACKDDACSCGYSHRPCSRTEHQMATWLILALAHKSEPWKYPLTSPLWCTCHKWDPQQHSEWTCPWLKVHIYSAYGWKNCEQAEH